MLPRLVIGLLILLASLPAAAKRIVVLPFSGVRGGEVTAAVTRRLGSRHQVVGRGQLRGNLGTAAGRSTAARAAKVAALISGSMSRSRGQWMVRAVVYSGHSGQVVSTSSVILRGMRIDLLSLNRLLGGIDRGVALSRTGPTLVAVTRTRYRTGPAVRAFRSARVASAGPAAADPAPAREDPPPTEEPRAEASAEDDPVSEVVDEDEDGPRARSVVKRRRVARASAEESDLGFDDSGEGAARSVDATARYRKRSMVKPPPAKTVEVGVGLTLVNRSFDFSDPADPNTANYRSGGVVPALLVQAGLYPFARFGKGFFSNLGVVGHYLRAVGLRSKQPGFTDDAPTSLDQLELGIRYRWNILDRPSSPVLKVGLSYGMQNFGIEWTNTTPEKAPLPNLGYMYLKLALGSLDLPFYSGSAFTIGGNASFDYMHVFNAGDIERPDEAGYGKSTTGGIDLGLGAYASYGAFFARVTGFYRRYFFNFDRSCVANNSGCKDAYGAVDAYLGVSAVGGVAF